MPDSSGRLTPEDNQKIQAWWGQHWKSPVICPVCKTDSWALGAHVVNVPRHGTDAFMAEAYPQLLVGCRTCGHTMFFNAVSIGVAPAYIPPPPPPPPPPPSSNLLHPVLPLSPANNLATPGVSDVFKDFLSPKKNG
jgi:hypothetical protein